MVKQETIERRAEMVVDFVLLKNHNPTMRRKDIIQAVADKHFVAIETVNVALLRADFVHKYTKHFDDIGAIVKTCIKCGETKSVHEFNFHPGTVDGYFGKCRACKKADERKAFEKRQLKKKMQKEELLNFK